jgi:multicomponent Na+:H+ antiporter subunit G
MAVVFALTGALFSLVAAAGLIRMPDLPTRMHASTKAGSLGAALILVAVALSQPGIGTTIRVVATVFFMFLTAPVASHAIARVSYRCGMIRLSRRTQFDQLEQSLRSETKAGGEEHGP